MRLPVTVLTTKEASQPRTCLASPGGVSVNFATGDAYQSFVIGEALHSVAFQDWPGKKNRPRKAGGETV